MKETHLSKLKETHEAKPKLLYVCKESSTEVIVDLLHNHC